MRLEPSWTNHFLSVPPLDIAALGTKPSTHKSLGDFSDPSHNSSCLHVAVSAVLLLLDQQGWSGPVLLLTVTHWNPWQKLLPLLLSAFRSFRRLGREDVKWSTRSGTQVFLLVPLLFPFLLFWLGSFHPCSTLSVLGYRIMERKREKKKKA